MAKKDTNDTINETLAKKIWLAGLGAYGRSLDEVHSRYEKLSGEGIKAFEDLVSKGEALQNETTEKVKDKVKESNTKLEARIDELKEKLSLTHSIDKKLDQVNSKIDKLSRSLSKKD
jgi:predicted RNase H-like nuclease (RuvC/YqgF family)